MKLPWVPRTLMHNECSDTKGIAGAIRNLAFSDFGTKESDRCNYVRSY